MVFARTFFFQSPNATAPAQPVVPAGTHFFMPGLPLPAFRAPAPVPPIPVAPARFVGRLGLPPRPPRIAPPRLVIEEGVHDKIEMVPLLPNHAFWAEYRSGGNPPVELDFMGLSAGPDPDNASSPSFNDWMEDDVSSDNM